MTSPRLKRGYFLLEALNSFATVYYVFYFYFYMHNAHGFDNRANLALAALNGITYMFAAWWGGRFAQRRGYFTALKIGFATMVIVLLVASLLTSASGQILAMQVFLVGMSLTWPTLEALVSEGERPTMLPRMIGRYNVVWAGTGALSYFTGGALQEHVGARSIFLVPAAMLSGQFALTLWLERLARRETDSGALPAATPGDPTAAEPPMPLPDLNPRPIARSRRFTRLAWLANPFSYIAINTLIAVVPGITARLGLSTMLAGFCCSLWCFARLGAFVAFTHWTGWHYRFGWLITAYLALAGSFATLLLIPSLAVLLMAQIIFGCAAGLLYYSSLFYSMDASDTKSEHGGIHEAVIGLGNAMGPAVGAASLWLWPQFPNAGTVAVSGLLLLGGGALWVVWKKG